jgi:hypothetical protein
MTNQPIITKPGIYPDLPEEVYHGDSFPAPVLSCGVIKDLILKSPQHAFINHPALNPQGEEEVEDKFDIGRTAHAMLLEGNDKVAVIDMDSWRTNEAKAMREQARAVGLIPLLRKDYTKVCEMVDAARFYLSKSELAINDLQAEGKSEQTFVWQDEGIWVKIRPDWMPNDGAYILDYKTTAKSANPEDIARHILSMGYDVQDALYKLGVYLLTGKQAKFVFMFQETSEPFLCSFVSLEPAFADVGYAKVMRGMEIWRQCLETNVWPGYPSMICHVEAPPYALAQLAELEAE